MRNILTHNYFEIDLDIVWLAVEQELPSLKQAIAAILRSLWAEVKDINSGCGLKAALKLSHKQSFKR